MMMSIALHGTMMMMSISLHGTQYRDWHIAHGLPESGDSTGESWTKSHPASH